jgi:hypothetical protein
MIEPRAWCVAYDDPRMGRIHSNPTMYKPEAESIIAISANNLTLVPLTTVADVLAALRNVTPEMCAKGFCVSEAEHDPKGVFLAMLDQFEKENK